MTPLPPKAELYLDELARLLAPAEPVDRIEILAGVREHLESSLADRPGASDAEVDAILAALGGPDAVARQAVPDAVAWPAPATTLAGGTAPVAPTASTPLLGRSWIPPVVAVLLCLAALVGALLAGTLQAQEAWSVDGDEMGPLLSFDGWALVLAWLVMAGPVWLPAVAVLWGSPLWDTRWKGAGTVASALPITLAALGAATGVALGGLMGLLAGMVGTIVLVVGLLRTARPA